MADMILTEQVNAAGISISKQQSMSVGDSGRQTVKVTVPGSTTDQEVTYALDVSQLQGIYIVSEDEDLTLETNNGSTPDDTINLKAGVPYLWHSNSYHTKLLTTDITKLYLTNGETGATTFRLISVADVTP